MKRKREATGCDDLDYYLEHPEECPDELNLCFKRLTGLPPEIGNLRNVVKLILSNNRLVNIPKEIGNLSNLWILDLSWNQLTDLPVEIGNLSHLRELILYRNQLTSIPKEIGNLCNLTALILDNNRLTGLPLEIGNLSKLVHLGLVYNQLTRVPEEIGNLSNLIHLYLKGNLNLMYPPYSMVHSNKNADMVEYLQRHNDIYSRYGRWKNQWPLIRLIFIGHYEKANRFNTIPMELLRVIEEYLLSDPFVETGNTIQLK